MYPMKFGHPAFSFPQISSEVLWDLRAHVVHLDEINQGVDIDRWKEPKADLGISMLSGWG